MEKDTAAAHPSSPKPLPIALVKHPVAKQLFTARLPILLHPFPAIKFIFKGQHVSRSPRPCLVYHWLWIAFILLGCAQSEADNLGVPEMSTVSLDPYRTDGNMGVSGKGVTVLNLHDASHSTTKGTYLPF